MQSVVCSFLFVTAIIACGSANAINKCTGPDGKAVFQDMPCSGTGEVIVVRPGSGYGPSAVPPTVGAPPSAASTPVKAQTESERLDALTAASQKQRRIQEFELGDVPRAANAINAQRAQCDRELRQLQEKKQSANNNLAGATWETSISSEMTAVATRCDTRNRDLRDDLDYVRKQCRELGGCKDL